MDDLHESATTAQIRTPVSRDNWCEWQTISPPCLGTIYKHPGNTAQRKDLELPKIYIMPPGAIEGWKYQISPVIEKESYVFCMPNYVESLLRAVYKWF